MGEQVDDELDDRGERAVHECDYKRHDYNEHQNDDRRAPQLVAVRPGDAPKLHLHLFGEFLSLFDDIRHR